MFSRNSSNLDEQMKMAADNTGAMISERDSIPSINE